MKHASPKAVLLLLAAPIASAALMILTAADEFAAPIAQSDRLRKVSAVSVFLGGLVEELNFERREAVLFTWRGGADRRAAYDSQIASTDEVAVVLNERISAVDDGSEWLSDLRTEIADTLDELDAIRRMTLERRAEPDGTYSARQEYVAYASLTNSIMGTLSRAFFQIEYDEQAEVLALITLLEIQDALGAEAGLGYAAFAGIGSLAEDHRDFLQIVARRWLMTERFMAIADPAWSEALGEILERPEYVALAESRDSIMEGGYGRRLDPDQAEPWLNGMLALQSEIATLKSRYLNELAHDMRNEAASLRSHAFDIAATAGLLLVVSFFTILFGYRAMRNELLARSPVEPEQRRRTGVSGDEADPVTFV